MTFDKNAVLQQFTSEERELNPRQCMSDADTRVRDERAGIKKVCPGEVSSSLRGEFQSNVWYR